MSPASQGASVTGGFAPAATGISDLVVDSTSGAAGLEEREGDAVSEARTGRGRPLTGAAVDAAG